MLADLSDNLLDTIYVASRHVRHPKSTRGELKLPPEHVLLSRPKRGQRAAERTSAEGVDSVNTLKRSDATARVFGTR